MIEKEILQEIQDLLADFSGIPLCLFKWKDLEHNFQKISYINPGLEQIAGCSWSYNPSFFRILEDATENRKEIEDLFREITKKLVAEKNFSPVVLSKGEHWGFGVIVSEIERKEGGKSFIRRPRYLLLGGPVHIQESPEWHDLFESELYHVEREARLDKSKQLQLASEFFELPCRPTQASLQEMARYLQYTFNGVVRDILPLIRDKVASARFQKIKILDLAVMLYELFRHVRNSDRYMKFLKLIYDRSREANLISAALAIGFGNPASPSGFMAVYAPQYSEDYKKYQLIFIPKQDDQDDKDDVEKMLDATKTDDFGERLLKWIEIPQYEDLRVYPLPFEQNESNLRGKLFIWYQKKIHERRHAKWFKQFLEPLLEGATITWETSKWRVVSRVMQTLSHHSDRKHNEFTDAVAAFSLPAVDEKPKETKPEQKDLDKILSIACATVGAKSIVYYRPELFRKPPVARPYAWSVTGSTEPNAFELTKGQFEKLFIELKPWTPEDEEAKVLLPVVSGNRALGILEVSLYSNVLFDHKLPLLTELSERLGLRIPYRRLVTFLRDLIAVLGEEGPDFDKLAEKIALYFSESACSIWTYNAEKRRFELRGRVGISFDDIKLNTYIEQDEAKDTLIFRCFEKNGGPLPVDLLDKSLPVRAKEELTAKGFKQGLALGLGDNKGWLGVILWSKAPYKENYYSSDDLTFLHLTVFTALQIIKLHKLIQRQHELRDLIMTGLGHELRAPLANIRGNVDRLVRTRDPKLAQDIKSIAEYVLEIANTLLSTTRLEEKLKKEPSNFFKKKAIPLFEGIIYKAINTVRWLAQRKGLNIVTHFDSKTFPSGLLLDEVQREWLFSIIFNLLDNAIKYTYKGEQSPIEIFGEVKEGIIVIRVRNYGIGVPAGEEELIFEAFKRGSNAFRGRPTGSGLGLYLSRQFAKALGGDLKLIRNADPTEFSLYLPLKLSATRWEVKKDAESTGRR